MIKLRLCLKIMKMQNFIDLVFLKLKIKDNIKFKIKNKE
jgi:hypothetical protein